MTQCTMDITHTSQAGQFTQYAGDYPCKLQADPEQHYDPVQEVHTATQPPPEPGRGEGGAPQASGLQAQGRFAYRAMGSSCHALPFS